MKNPFDTIEVPEWLRQVSTDEVTEKWTIETDFDYVDFDGIGKTAYPLLAKLADGTPLYQVDEVKIEGLEFEYEISTLAFKDGIMLLEGYNMEGDPFFFEVPLEKIVEKVDHDFS